MPHSSHWLIPFLRWSRPPLPPALDMMAAESIKLVIRNLMESPTLGFKELPGYFDVDSGKNYNHDDNEIN